MVGYLKELYDAGVDEVVAEDGEMKSIQEVGVEVLAMRNYLAGMREFMDFGRLAGSLIEEEKEEDNV